MRVLAAICALLVGCSTSSENSAVDLARVVDPLIVTRSYQSHVPPSYDPATPMPLVILLHGYGVNGAAQDLFFGLTETSDTAGFLYAYPDGTTNSLGSGFWNATDGCCNFEGSPVDDVAYLNAVIDDMSARYNVDAKRVYFLGHSNGGFMSYRMACESGARIAGIVVLAGAMWIDVTKCPAGTPVPVLHVHGDDDQVISYDGRAPGGGLPGYPSAKQSIADWATINGCGAVTDTSETLDLVTGAAVETKVARAACPAGRGAELWTITGGSHYPSFNMPTWGDKIIGWLGQFERP